MQATSAEPFETAHSYVIVRIAALEAARKLLTDAQTADERKAAVMALLKAIEKAGQTCQRPFLRWLVHLVHDKRINEETHATIALPPITAASLLADTAVSTPGIASLAEEFAHFSLRRHTSIGAKQKPGIGVWAQHVNALAFQLAAEPPRRKSMITALVQQLATGSFVRIEVRFL